MLPFKNEENEENSTHLSSIFASNTGIRLHSSRMILSHRRKPGNVYTRLLNNSKIHKTIHIHSCSTVQRALCFSRAVRQTLLSQQHTADLEITEIEEYLGFLRSNRLVIETRVAEAEEQIGVIREVVDQHRVFGPGGSTTDIDEPSFPTSSSSSFGSDDHTEPPSSDDQASWNKGELTAVPDLPSIKSQRQKFMDDLTEGDWATWEVPVSDDE